MVTAWFIQCHFGFAAGGRRAFAGVQITGAMEEIRERSGGAGSLQTRRLGEAALQTLAGSSWITYWLLLPLGPVLQGTVCQ